MTVRRVTSAFCAALIVLAVGDRVGAAVSFTLTEAQKQDAIRFGQRSVDLAAFDAEWRVDNAAGESVVVLTPFHRLVVAARHAAFRNEPLKSGEPDRLLRQQRDRLLFLAELKGPREDFARSYRPELVVERRVVKPTFVQNERSALKQDNGYLARCVYGFAVKDFTGTSRVSLIVRDADGREASAFTIDLGRMR